MRCISGYTVISPSNSMEGRSLVSSVILARRQGISTGRQKNMTVLVHISTPCRKPHLSRTALYSL